MDAGIKDVELQVILSGNERKLLQQALGIDLKKVDWLEGINEFYTQRKLGRVLHNCAYNTNDVPAAKRLELLSQDLTGKSLVESMYQTRSSFIHQLQHICHMLAAQERQKNTA